MASPLIGTCDAFTAWCRSTMRFAKHMLKKGSDTFLPSVSAGKAAYWNEWTAYMQNADPRRCEQSLKVPYWITYFFKRWPPCLINGLNAYSYLQLYVSRNILTSSSYVFVVSYDVWTKKKNTHITYWSNKYSITCLTGLINDSDCVVFFRHLLIYIFSTVMKLL